MPTRAACAGSEVPAPSPPSAQGTTRPCSPATSSRPIVLRTHWTPSPRRRLSRPPWWRVTATTTTGPPPRPDGNSGRCACPQPRRARRGTAGTLPTFTHRPVSSCICNTGAEASLRSQMRVIALREKQSREVPSSSPAQLPLSDKRSHALDLGRGPFGRARRRVSARSLPATCLSPARGHQAIGDDVRGALVGETPAPAPTASDEPRVEAKVYPLGSPV